jgi:hypothetical protein
MYVWRLPLFSFAALSSTAIVVCALAAVLAIRRRIAAPVLRGIVSSVAVVMLLGSPALTEALIRWPVAGAIQGGMYIDPSPLILWLPAIGAVFLLVAARLLFPAAATSGVALKYRCWFVALVLGFVLLNCANWCSPGWCERFGFPLAYSWWSDGMVILDGKNWSAGFSSAAIVLDVLIAGAASLAVAGSYRQKQNSIPSSDAGR